MCDLQSSSLQTNARRVTPHKRGRPDYGRGVRHANCNRLFLVFQQFITDHGLVSSRKAAPQLSVASGALQKHWALLSTTEYSTIIILHTQANLFRNVSIVLVKFKSFNFPKYSDIRKSLKMSRHLMIIALRNLQKLQPLYFFQVIFDMIQLYTY